MKDKGLALAYVQNLYMYPGVGDFVQVRVTEIQKRPQGPVYHHQSWVRNLPFPEVDIVSRLCIVHIQYFDSEKNILNQVKHCRRKQTCMFISQRKIIQVKTSNNIVCYDTYTIEVHPKSELVNPKQHKKLIRIHML